MFEITGGSGRHPITMIAISANDLAGSAGFYSRVFGWQTRKLDDNLVAAVAPGGPAVTLRAGTPQGFPGMVPFIAVPDVAKALDRIGPAGGSVERPPWTVPMAGTLARFQDPFGTIYGLSSAVPAGAIPPVPMPFGDNPKPPVNSICSVEMYASDPGQAAGFFGPEFGWGTAETIPGYLGFHPGAGIGGVFQSHTPSLPAVAYIWVDSVETRIEELEKAGGKRSADPMRAPGMGCFGYFTDPSGTAMGMIGP